MMKKMDDFMETVIETKRVAKEAVGGKKECRDRAQRKQEHCKLNFEELKMKMVVHFEKCNRRSPMRAKTCKCESARFIA